MKKIFFVMISFLILAGATAALAEEKPRIGVLRFTNTAHAPWWSGSTATELQDLLINELASTKSFRVLERRELKSVVSEQQLSESGLVDSSTKLTTGRIKVAQYLVAATVSAFEESGSEGGGVNYRGFSFGGGKKTAYIAVDLKVVDAGTGEIVDTRTIEATSTSGGMRVSGPSGMVPGLSGSLGKQAKTPTGKVIRGCIVEITEYLECSLVLKDDDCLKKYSAKETRRRAKTKSSIDLDE